MLEFDICDYKIRFSFSFFSLLAFVFCTEQWYITIFTLIACVAHEIGHLITLRCYNVKMSSLLFYCGGIKIKYDSYLLPLNKQITVYLSGVISNFILALLAFYMKLEIMYLTNLLIGIYNLLPFRHFDGGQIINTIKENSNRTVLWNILNIFRLSISICLLMICVIMFYNGKVNLSLIITVIYVLISEFISI